MSIVDLEIVQIVKMKNNWYQLTDIGADISFEILTLRFSMHGSIGCTFKAYQELEGNSINNVVFYHHK